MEIKNKILQEMRSIFEKLKTYEKSVLFSEEKLNIKLFKKLKKSRYPGDKKLLKLINLAENNIEQISENNENIMPIRKIFEFTKNLNVIKIMSISYPLLKQFTMYMKALMKH